MVRTLKTRRMTNASGTSAVVREVIKELNAQDRQMPSPNGRTGVVAMTVTPALAADWLGGNIKNRQLRDYRVTKLASEMKHGRWAALNGETIKIGKDGRLLDGQHRLAAVIVSDTPIETYVAFGVDDEAFRTIDTGLRRSIRDALFLMDEPQTKQLALTLNAMYRYLLTGQFFFTVPPSNVEMLNVLEACPGLRETADKAAKLAKKLPSLKVGPAAVLLYLFNEKSPEDAAYFEDRLRTGESLALSDPIYVLRERLLKPSGGRAQSGPTNTAGFKAQQEMAVLMVKTWNAFRENRELGPRGLRVYDEELLPAIV